jgi:hypothetical protein
LDIASTPYDALGYTFNKEEKLYLINRGDVKFFKGLSYFVRPGRFIKVLSEKMLQPLGSRARAPQPSIEDVLKA